ncbi:Phragmoplast-associated kinesin-related protein [Heracleum sosnowskyi]|uniref:Phragmoplast-associated kinesin-related protein n=1 Tax=Heracleum sosnowskyi TaxID=360622 RepID=A0AAD8GY89_9APIA|nr:Phragmoplast-associated kinesin-related protein [Heracleum sosnowskyi]
MKHFMLPRSPTILRDATDTPSSTSPNPSPLKRSNRKHKLSKENAPPTNNFPESLSHSPSLALKPSRGLPPRPPPNPLKRKINVDAVVDAASSDSGVKVIVRMRPPNKDDGDGELIDLKNSGESLSVAGQTFTFDSVADFTSTQLDIFQLVGAPLVENCLAGFNNSVFAYGQTGSGKTYTIWGPANAYLEEKFSSDHLGLTPRVFERLFSRIEEEQTKHGDKQLRYQCRCSFLEIYNEQITDLLDPSQRSLQIREDVKTGVYVENLREECVCTMKDVTQLLLKGLSNRRIGATSTNAESSRSHCVITCVVESRSKSVADGLTCFKSSRINLVDLAGSERQKLTGAAGERLKEAGNINRSLSQLGNLINILAEVSQTGKQRHIPYRDSKLTFLLQESLGGNAKLAMVCAISPAQSCKSETLGTLRFAQRAKALKNKAVVNEEMQDDVNVLRQVIKQLKEELSQMKNKENQIESKGSYTSGWNARRSLNLLKFSLNRPITLPHVDDDGDEEMEIVEQAEEISLLLADIEENNGMDQKKVESLQSADTNLMVPTELKRITAERQACLPITGSEEKKHLEGRKLEDLYENETDKLLVTSGADFRKQRGSENTNVDMAYETFEQAASHGDVLHGESSINTVSRLRNSEENLVSRRNENSEQHDPDPSEFSMVTCEVSPLLKSPTASVSPKLSNSCRKSLKTSSTSTASQKDLIDTSLIPKSADLSFAKPYKNIGLNVQSNRDIKSYDGLSKHLAASLQRGFEILNNCQSSGLRRSSFRFSYKCCDTESVLRVKKVDVGIQTFPEDSEVAEADPLSILCYKCKGMHSEESKDASSNIELVTVDDVSLLADKSRMQVPKAVEKVLAGAIRREMALEEYCTKQNLEIRQLNRLVQQYKHERECNAIIGQMREDKIVRLESLMDGVLLKEDFLEDEIVSLRDENKILKNQYDNHPELLSTKVELKRVQGKLESYRNFYDMGERDVLVEEIQDLRSQLQYYTDASPKSIGIRCPLQLTNTSSSLCSVPGSTEDNVEHKLEMERLVWAEAESKWISLAEELRTELEASRVLLKKQKEELDMEKKCSEELKVSMQMAMEGHARMIEQYADLQEKHVQLLDRHRKIQEGIEDVKKTAARAGVRGAESRFINILAAEISALKVEKEKESSYLREENRGLQAQLRDTAEAVQAAGELLIRLKEAEEAVANCQALAADAVEESKKAYKQIDDLKRKRETDVCTCQLPANSCLLKETVGPVYHDSNMVEDDAVGLDSKADERYRDNFESFYNAEVDSPRLVEEPSSWFSGYDRCNI